MSRMWGSIGRVAASWFCKHGCSGSSPFCSLRSHQAVGLRSAEAHHRDHANPVGDSSHKLVR
eukprot:5521520-Prorocentrum_lima.AAC.1